MGMLDTRDNDLSFDGEERRANVVLRGDILSRTVDRVEWFAQAEEIVSIDVYNRYGWRSKQSLLTEAGQSYLDIYLNRQQEEVLLHFVSQGTFCFKLLRDGIACMPVRKSYKELS